MSGENVRFGSDMYGFPGKFGSSNTGDTLVPLNGYIEKVQQSYR